VGERGREQGLHNSTIHMKISRILSSGYNDADIEYRKR
jgi:hypothetical protein